MKGYRKNKICRTFFGIERSSMGFIFCKEDFRLGRTKTINEKEEEEEGEELLPKKHVELLSVKKSLVGLLSTKKVGR